MKNSLADLCDHLFVAIERLNEEDMPEDKLAIEVKRANAIAGVAREVIGAGQLAISAAQRLSEDPGLRPRLLGLDKTGSDQGR
jgi:hypothetical protein